MASGFARRVLFASPWWHSDIVNGVIKHAANRGWHIDLQTCLSGILPERWEGDGIITQLGGDLDAHRRFIANVGCPAVSLNGNFPELGIPCVSTNSAAAGTLAAEHLMDRGFRSYAFYASTQRPKTMQRYDAFVSRLEEAGHAVELLSWPDEHGNRADGWDVRRRWLARRIGTLEKPVGVFAFNDQAAVEVIEACLARSIDVPDHVAVLGMLNMEIFRLSTTVGLSSIGFDFDRMTALACDMLGRMMDGEPAPTQPTLIPPTGVVVRQSTDTFAARSPAVARAVRFILDHYAEPIGTGDIVQAAGGSRAGLFKAFKADLDQTPGHVLMRVRVERAKRMLEDTNEKVYTVAAVCGFGKPVNLHRVFKQVTGMSPIEHRKAHQAAATGAD